MMAWSRRSTLIAGIGLIALTNAVALIGVAYNRSGDPEAVLRLTQRELRTPYQWGGNGENSGMELGLLWRQLGEEPGSAGISGDYPSAGGSPAWLDRAKLDELGFDTAVSASAPDSRERRRYEKQLPRDVLLVLELDGPAYRRALERATKYSADEAAKSAANPADKRQGERAKNARTALEWETSGNSRLFVVDAGLDPAALRAKYPDRARYAVVRGRMGLQVTGNQFVPRVAGHIGGLSVGEINVPYELRNLFDGAPLYDAPQYGSVPGQQKKKPFEATVGFGKRLEPWIIAAAKK